MPKHDEVYKQLFSHPEFVQQQIEAFAPQELAQNLDFSTLENHSGEYVTSNLRKRSQDLVWSAKLVSGEPLYLFILLEFQSKNDYSMPVRKLEWFAEGKEAGMQKGREEGVGKGRLVTLRGTLEKLLQLKFRTVDEHFLQRIATANEQELELWTERVLFADSLEAVFAVSFLQCSVTGASPREV